MMDDGRDVTVTPTRLGPEALTPGMSFVILRNVSPKNFAHRRKTGIAIFDIFVLAPKLRMELQMC